MLVRLTIYLKEGPILQSNSDFEIYQKLHEFSRNMHLLAHKIGEQQGYSQEIGRLLNFIKNKEGYCTPKDLAQYLHITPASTTTKINHLLKKKFVIKTVSKKDQRSFYLSLTDLGESQRQKINLDTAKIVSALFEDLSKEQKQELLVLLAKISTKF